MKDARSSTTTIAAVGVAVIIVGLLAWPLSGSATLGLALVALGVGALVAAAIRRPTTSTPTAASGDRGEVPAPGPADPLSGTPAGTPAHAPAGAHEAAHTDHTHHGDRSHDEHPHDGDRAESAIRRERADQQRLHDQTDAVAEDAEQRPPPTGA